MNVTLVTKDQLLGILAAWGVSEPPPRKGQALRVCFPPPATLNLATVTPDKARSTYGKPLFRVELQDTRRDVGNPTP